ncbi:general secretion pathway protein K [Comamonas odontotermitis]|uniref:General secretion pathway protein K n=1 Tax=Comamonas odontotermitis TaxID=379895 RepID=A0ABR6RCB4_9BURK|nr:type II secretion system protein GspK [Comamonas odontotermitis]MBB6576798.1 general secretion pathway protein K [Comamonas odontotermitis]
MRLGRKRSLQQGSQAYSAGQHAGMALIAVLWLVAALSLMVTGVSGVVRQEARMVGVAKDRVTAHAMGDAAVMLVLQQLVADRNVVWKWTDTSVNYQGAEISVSVMPLSGLININGASLPLLTALLTIGGGVPEGPAQEIAISILDRRERSSLDGRRPERFEAIEDLMQIPGIDYDLYARLAPLITASSSGSGGAAVNPLAAPPEVLRILANGNEGVVNQILAARASGDGASVDTTGLDGNLSRAGSAQRRYRVTAKVPMADGRFFLVDRSVYFGSRTRDGLPWYTFEARQMLQPAS